MTRAVLAVVILAVVLAAVGVCPSSPTVDTVISADVVGRAYGIVRSLQPAPDASSPVQVASVQLEDGSLVEAPVLPGYKVHLGGVAVLDIVQSNDY